MKKKFSPAEGATRLLYPQGMEMLIQQLREFSTPASDLLLEYLEQSYCLRPEQEGDGQAFREVFPSTEIMVDVKTLTRVAGRMLQGEFLFGIFARDAEDHFIFYQLPNNFFNNLPNN